MFTEILHPVTLHGDYSLSDSIIECRGTLFLMLGCFTPRSKMFIELYFKHIQLYIVLYLYRRSYLGGFYLIGYISTCKQRKCVHVETFFAIRVHMGRVGH